MNDTEHPEDRPRDRESKVDSTANDMSAEAGIESSPSEKTQPEKVGTEAGELADSEFKILSESISESVVEEIHVIGDDAGSPVLEFQKDAAEFRKEVAVEAIVIGDVDEAGGDKPPVAIDPGVVAAAAIEAKKPPPVWQQKIPSKLVSESISSTGGAVGSVALGVLSIKTMSAYCVGDLKSHSIP